MKYSECLKYFSFKHNIYDTIVFYILYISNRKIENISYFSIQIIRLIVNFSIWNTKYKIFLCSPLQTQNIKYNCIIKKLCYKYCFSNKSISNTYAQPWQYQTVAHASGKLLAATVRIHARTRLKIRLAIWILVHVGLSSRRAGTSRVPGFYSSRKGSTNPEEEGRMENARVTNIWRVPQFYSPAEEPYLASSSFEQFKALSRVESADDLFRDSDDDFRHIPHVKKPAAIFLF